MMIKWLVLCYLNLFDLLATNLLVNVLQVAEEMNPFFQIDIQENNYWYIASIKAMFITMLYPFKFQRHLLGYKLGIKIALLCYTVVTLNHLVLLYITLGN